MGKGKGWPTIGGGWPCCREQGRRWWGGGSWIDVVEQVQGEEKAIVGGCMGVD